VCIVWDINRTGPLANYHQPHCMRKLFEAVSRGARAFR
jgi:hypothetical protein